MSSSGISLAAFLKRALFAAPFFVGAWLVLTHVGTATGAIFGPILAIVLSLVGAVIVAAPAARLLAEPFGSFFLPERYNSRRVPMYGIPESMRKKGQYNEAIAGFMEIAKAYPRELEPYLAAIDTALMDLRDRGLADALYQKGLRKLKKKQSRLTLTQAYEAIRTRLEPTPATQAQNRTQRGDSGTPWTLRPNRPDSR